MPCANHVESLEWLIGKKVVGVIVGAFPVGQPSTDNNTFILDDGTAFTFKSNAAFWVESKRDVKMALTSHRIKLERLAAAEKEILRMAGQIGEVA